MFEATKSMQVFGGAIWALIAGALTSFGAFLAYMIFSYIWTEISGNKLSKIVKLAAFLAVGILFLGLGGAFAPLAIGAFLTVGISEDDSTPKIVDIAFFVFYFGAILLYLAFYLKDVVTERRSIASTEGEGEHDVGGNGG